ncbi:glycoside hydrolase family 66 protein [Gracilibacillus sp. YIM 98692]|uniref:glycoside hydrolase family 66 protein n=1 Tax=Gracilibacillus sp. YIM 98692 TaxID=2663532 RepID=UPI0013D66EE8|nr:glycoside hydrolase family 66 protein [Gracilibacillus sp. YIM 98692]
MKKLLMSLLIVILIHPILLDVQPVQQVKANSDDFIQRVYTDNAMYDPGSPVNITVELQNNGSSDWTGEIHLLINHLESEVYSDYTTVTVNAESETTATFTWTAPPENFKGYFVEVSAGSDKGYTAVDVSTDWTRYPRYGFMDYYKEEEPYAEVRSRVQQTVQDYHTNAFQLYDWMWRHDNLIKRTDGTIDSYWEDWDGNLIYWDTINNLIDAIHDQNGAAMPYTMSYAAYEGYEQRAVSPEWGIYEDQNNDSQVGFNFGDDDPYTNLWLFDPSNIDWQGHMYDEYFDAINTAGFDGIHLDQLGERNNVYDYDGNLVDLESTFSNFVNNLQTDLENNNYGDKIVTFNIVNGARDGWAANDVLQNADTDFDYSEIWEDAPTYYDLADYVTHARKENGGKAMVLAAYLNHEENPGDRYEAEDATLTNVGTNDNHSNYTGSGFVDQFGETGDAVEFNISVPENGKYSLVFRYANDTGSPATRSVYVDGNEVEQLEHISHGSWDKWNLGAYSVVELDSGSHTVRIQVDEEDEGYINLDSLTLGTFDEEAVRLANAAMASSGAFHIEMGEGDQMLGHPYFPNHNKQMRSSLKEAMKHHYNFITAYENLLFDPEVIPNDTGEQFIDIAGEDISGDAKEDTIWYSLKRTTDYNMVHLINLTNNNETEWRYSKNEPALKQNLDTKVYIGDQETIHNVYLASPDIYGGKTEEISFTTGRDENGKYVSFTVPSLKYWDMIYMKRTFDEPGYHVYEAEEELLTNVNVNNNHSGYTGNGFVDQFAEENDGVSFVVAEAQIGSNTLKFKYSNGGSDATRDVFLDGEYAGTISFTNTGGWDQWAYAGLPVDLTDGYHTVVLWYTGNNQAAINLDHLKLE